MKNLDIRPATAYVPALAPIYNELLTTLHLDSPQEHSSERIQKVIASPVSQLYFGYLDSDQPVAMGILIGPFPIFDRTEGMIEDVAVLPGHQGNGYGKQLVQHLLDEAKTQEINRVQLHSSSKRQAAHAVYRKLGFEAYDTQFFRIDLD